MTVRTLGSLGRLEPGSVGAGGASGSKQCGRGRQPAALRVSACLRSFLPSFLHSLSKYAFMRCQVSPSLSILGLGRAACVPSVHSPSWSVSEQRQGLDQAWWGCRNVPG